MPVLGGGSQPPPSSPGGDRTAGPSSTIPDTPSSNSNSSNSNSNSSSNNNNKNNGGSGAAGTENIGIPKVLKWFCLKRCWEPEQFVKNSHPRMRNPASQSTYSIYPEVPQCLSPRSNWVPPPFSRERVSPPSTPGRNQRGGGPHSPGGEEVGESQFGRLDK